MMPDMEKVIKGLECCYCNFPKQMDCKNCPYDKICYHDKACSLMLRDALALLKEQDERLRKLQKDKDKLCLEVSEWKHKFHDAPPNFVSQGVVDQICWERDTALSQLEQIGKGLGSKMDDIVALLKEQEAVTIKKTKEHGFGVYGGICPKCRNWIQSAHSFCGFCGQAVKWE